MSSSPRIDYEPESDEPKQSTTTHESEPESPVVPTPGARHWVVNGVLAGVCGAAVVSIFFLLVDMAEGRAFFTPAALGSNLFLRESLSSQSPWLALVSGYTVLHGAAFLAAGLLAAQLVDMTRRRIGALYGLVLGVGIFAGLELFFVSFLWLNAPELIGEFGAGRIAMANLLSALAMSFLLLWLSTRDPDLPH